MRKLLLATCLIAAASPAFADGNGVVTKIRSLGGQNPNCILFQTNSGPTWYGISVSEPTVDQAQTTLAVSRIFKFPVSFVALSPNPDCPSAFDIVALDW